MPSYMECGGTASGILAFHVALCASAHGYKALGALAMCLGTA